MTWLEEGQIKDEIYQLSAAKALAKRRLEVELDKGNGIAVGRLMVCIEQIDRSLANLYIKLSEAA